ncbi:2-keto-4-pentenoate hydratase [Falsiroseomonas sp. HW251]|uniref:2-keto-4-pentenoate hydratase n=1 Tax=Falsiroseomonas sp. HW251 TaxID=3390998 RepID=UPI003D3132AD
MLLAVRQGGAVLRGLGDGAPADEAEAWAVQLEVLRRRDGRIGGYKCATPQGKPTSAALLDARGLKTSPASWPLPAGARIGIETEVAFRLARDLPPRAAPYEGAEMPDAIESCFPAIELVVSRFADVGAVSRLEVAADNIAHEALVCGAAVADWRRLDLNDLHVRQSAGGAVQVERRGASPPGHPLQSLAWLANHLQSFGLHLRAGEVVTTGSWTGLLHVPGGQRVVGGFRELGEVVVELG